MDYFECMFVSQLESANNPEKSKTSRIQKRKWWNYGDLL